MLRKLGQNYQVAIPKDQQYFYTPEWKEEEREASGDIEEARITKTKNLNELFNEKWQKAIKKSEEEIKKGHYKVYRSSKELEKDIEK